MKTLRSGLQALIVTSYGKIPALLLHSPNNTLTHKHTHACTQAPRTEKHRQMRHDVQKPLSNTDNTAAINTHNLFQHPSFSLTRHFVSSPLYQISRDKARKTHKYVNTHTHCVQDLLRMDTSSCSCTCFRQDHDVQSWSCLSKWKI